MNSGGDLWDRIRRRSGLPHGYDPGVETLEQPEESARTRITTPHDEDVAHGVVLPVVDLTLDDTVDDGTALLTARPDVQEDSGIVPVDELRRDDAGVGAEGLLDGLVDGVGIDRHVVVAQQEGGALDHGQRLVGPRPSRRVAPEDRTNTSGRIPPTTGRRRRRRRSRHQDGELLVVLRRPGGERLFEPGAGLGRDHDGDRGRLGRPSGERLSGWRIGPFGTNGGFRHEIGTRATSTV